jgi:hypothetical protein
LQMQSQQVSCVLAKKRAKENERERNEKDTGPNESPTGYSTEVGIFDVSSTTVTINSSYIAAVGVCLQRVELSAGFAERLHYRGPLSRNPAQNDSFGAGRMPGEKRISWDFLGGEILSCAGLPGSGFLLL